MICRKATVALPDANFLSSWCQSQSPRAQKRHFCAFLGFETLVFERFEHKIGVFVRFWLPEPPFSGFSSTKSVFLCFFGLRNPRFQGFRAQNRGFCALFPEKVGSAERGNLVGASAERGNLISASAGRGNLVGASAERGNLVAASARHGNLFSTPAWRGNLIAARTASGVAERSRRLSSRRGKWRGITASPLGVGGEG